MLIFIFCRCKMVTQIHFIVSAFFYLLYLILNMLDIGKVPREMFNITDVASFKRPSLVFMYVFTYYICIFKSMMGLFTVFILTLIIRIIITSSFDFIADKKNDNKGGAKQITTDIKTMIESKISAAAKDNFNYMFSFVLDKRFIIIFLVAIPLCLFILLILYGAFINKEDIQEKNEMEAPRIMTTHHHFILMCMTCFMLGGFVFMVGLWIADDVLAKKK